MWTIQILGLFWAQEKSWKIQKVHFFVTSSIVAIKSASRPSTFCDNQSCITNAQSNFAADGCTIYTKTEPWLFQSQYVFRISLLALLFILKINARLHRWVTLCASSLITSEFRTMMRKKLTNSQLITIRREMSEFVFPNSPTDVLLQIGTSDVYLFNDDYDDHWQWEARSFQSVMPLFTSCPQ